jgi:hypothetical protein
MFFVGRVFFDGPRCSCIRAFEWPRRVRRASPTRLSVAAALRSVATASLRFPASLAGRPQLPCCGVRRRAAHPCSNLPPDFRLSSSSPEDQGLSMTGRLRVRQHRLTRASARVERRRLCRRRPKGRGRRPSNREATSAFNVLVAPVADSSSSRAVRASCPRSTTAS